MKGIIKCPKCEHELTAEAFVRWAPQDEVSLTFNFAPGSTSIGLAEIGRSATAMADLLEALGATHGAKITAILAGIELTDKGVTIKARVALPAPAP